MNVDADDHPPAVADAPGSFEPPPAASGAAPARFLNRSAYVCFTVHNATWYDLDGQHPYFAPVMHELAEASFAAGKLSYFIAQGERCPTTQRVHIQGYCEASTRRSFDAWRKILIFTDGDPWLSTARGTGQQNRDYCSKGDSFIGWRLELGQLRNVGAGARTDLLAVKRLLDTGTSQLDIWRDDATFPTMVRNFKGFDRYEAMLNVSRGNAVQRIVIVYWGPTGTGKSHSAMTRFPDFYPVPDAKGSGLYFDGYGWQSALLVDEMHGGRMQHSFLLNLCGNAPILLPTHGGFTPLSSRTTHIVFTSDSHPAHWYAKLYATNDKLWPMLERRIAEVHHLTDRYIDDNIIVRHWPAPAPAAPGDIDNRVLFHE